MLRVLLASLGLWTAAVAHAATIAGVEFPDAAEVGGRPVVLNGVGLREFLFLDIYAGALYLPEPTRDATRALESDVPKRIVMHFLFRKVTAEKMRETFAEGLAKLPNRDALAGRFEQLNDMMGTVHRGDVVVLDYVPGEGTTIRYNGEPQGTLPGADLMQAIWSIYIGPDPASEKLKRGLVGG